MTFRVPKLNGLLQASLLIMTIKVVLNSSSVAFYTETIDTILSFAAAGGMLIVFLSYGHSVRTLITYGCALLLSGYCAYVTGNFFFFITFLTCLAIQKANFDHVIRHIFLYEVLLVGVVIASSLVKYVSLDEPISVMFGTTERFILGFKHPNSLSAFFMNILMMYAWINYERMGFKRALGILFVGILMYMLTKTRTMMLCVVLMCVLLVMRKKENSLRLSRVAKYSIPVFSVFMIVLVYLYLEESTLVLLLDTFSSSRIKLGAYALENYGFTLLGQDLREMSVVWDEQWMISGHTFDNVYTYLMMNIGLVWLIVIAIIFYNLAKRRDNKINIFLILWAAYGFSEVVGVNGYMSFPILIAGMAEFRHQRTEKYTKQLPTEMNNIPKHCE